MDSKTLKKFEKRYKKGDILFCEFELGSSVFFLQSGTVKITKILADKEKILAILGPGDIFGEMAILEKAPRSATAIVEEDTQVLEFSNESFAQLVNAQPSIAIKLLKLLADRIKDQSRKFKIINLPSNDYKVMDVFLMLAENRGINPEKDTSNNISFEVDSGTIASWAGIPEADADQILKDMENQKRIKRNENCIIVLNLYQLFRHVSSKRLSMETDDAH